ncbi:MAG: hypothetical protein KDK12_09725 [Rhodobacteraceae bacterium]|nr:hypothetical protein [Paracoccaceae bacterium]
MTRVAVIGNSHVGALKLAWRRFADSRADITLRFFASFGDTYRKLRLDEHRHYGALDADRFAEDELDSLRQLNRRLTINLRSFDVVVNVGAPAFQVHDLPTLVQRTDIDGLAEIGAPLLLSHACYEAFLADLVAEALPGPEWRNWEETRLLMVPPPRYAEIALPADDPEPARQRAAKARLDALLTQAMDGIGARYVPQPDETLADNGLTQRRFNRGAVGARVNRTRDDPTHMNEDYGALQWREILAHLS